MAITPRSFSEKREYKEHRKAKHSITWCSSRTRWSSAMGDGSLLPGTFHRWKNREHRERHVNRESELIQQVPRLRTSEKTDGWSQRKMPDVDLVNRHPALQSMCSKD